MSVGIASSTSGNSGDDYSFSEYYSEGGVIRIYLQVALSGLEFMNNTISCHPGFKLDMLYSLSGIPSDCGRTYIEYKNYNSYNSGLNITGENCTHAKVNGDNVLLLAGGITLVAAATALAVITAGAGTPVAVTAATYALNALSVADEVASYSKQVSPNYLYYINGGEYTPGESPSYVNSSIDNGTGVCNSTFDYYYFFNQITTGPFFVN
ncbi:MAG: hypothetical protein QXQ46_09990 [Thermoplasmatales archaeon]